MAKYNVGFPDEFAHPNTKAKNKWGLQSVKAIWDYGTVHCSWGFHDRRKRFHDNELLSQGMQNPGKYKPIFGDARTGKVDYMQMFWQSTSPLPIYIRSVIRALTEQKYEPTVTAFDATSKSIKDKQYAREKGNYYLKQMQENQLKDTGIKLVSDSEEVAGSVEEIELRKELGYKVSLEIAQQIGIKCVLDNNNWQYEKRDTAANLTKKSWACVETYYDEHGNIRVESFDPSDLGVPYSSDQYFKNRKFTFRYKRFTITEVRAWNNNNGKKVYTDEEIFYMAAGVAGKDKNGQWDKNFEMGDFNQSYNSFVVNVISYEINTINRTSWLQREDKDGKMKFNKTKAHSKAKESDKKELISKERQVWYDGLWVVDSNKLLRHELRSNEMYEGGEQGFYDNRPRSRFVVCAPEIYLMRNKALPESAEPYVDNMHKAILKYQQFLNEIAPPAIRANIDMMTSALKGLGISGNNPMDAMNIAKQTRVFWYSFQGQDPSKIDQNVISEINSSINSEINAITELYNQNLMALEREIGVNDTMIGQTRNKYEGVGSREIKLQAGNRALSHLYDAQNFIEDEVCKNVAIMVQDTLTRGENIKGFENAIGKENVKVISLQKDMTLAELGMKLEVLPTEEDINELSRKIDLALQRDTIRIEDAMIVEKMAKMDTKLAFRFMNLKQHEYEAQRMREAQNAAAANSEQQQQSAAMAAELAKKEAMMKHSIAIEMEEWKKSLEEKNQQAKHLDDMDEERLKGEMKIKQIREANINDLQNTEINNKSMQQPKVYTGT